MAEKNTKKTLKVASTSLLAVTMLGTTVGTNFANAEDAPAKDDDNKKTEEGKQASIPVNVDDSKLKDAVKKAKDAGVKVDQEQTQNKTVKTDESSQAKKDIEADYDKQIKDLEEKTKIAESNAKKQAQYDKEMEQYKKDKAEFDKKDKAYQDAIKNPQFNGSDKTEFSKEKLQEFLGKDPQNVTYINGNTASKKMTFDKGNMEVAPDSVKKDWRSSTSIHKKSDGTKDPDYTDGKGYEYDGNKNRNLYKVKKGSTWGYKHVFKDGKTGHDVDMKYTVKGIKHKDGNKFDGDYIEILHNRLGFIYFHPIEALDIEVEYFDSKTGKPVKIDALNGMGDIDASQYYKLNTKMDDALKGSKVVKKGDQYWEAEPGHEDYKPDNPGTQVWTIAKGVDKQTFTFGSNVDNAQTFRHSIFFENGHIDFGLKLPEKPTAPDEPEKPKLKEQNAKYQLTNLNVTPENHKDVEKGVQKDDTDASIDKEGVEVGDTITYPLTNSDLPADRKDDMKSYVVKDELPDGVVPNEKEIEKNVDKSKWDVKIDGQKVEFSATKELLADMNKDKTKAYKVPTIGLVATVDKAGDANFENTFDTIINDQTVKSNQVSNKAPEVTKSSLEKYIVEDGKLVKENKAKKGDDVNYRINYNIGNDKETNKVVFSDDLEDVLDINKDSVKVYEVDEKDAQSDDAKSDDNATNDKASDDKASDDKASDDKASDDNGSEEATGGAGGEEKSTDDATSDEEKTDDEATEDDAKTDEKSDDAKTDEKSDDAKSDDAKSEEGKEAVKGKEITDQGELKVDEDKETFEWVAKDPKSMRGKSFYVEVTGKAKTDGDYSKYEKDGKATIPNVAKLTVDGDSMDSNEVKTEIPNEEKPKPEPKPKKEDPKQDPKQDPENPAPAPNGSGNGGKPIPNTGGENGFFDKIAQTFYNVFK